MQTSQFQGQIVEITSATAPALTTSYAVGRYNSTAARNAGASQAQQFTLKVTRANAGALTGATFKLQQSYDGANATTANAANWTDVCVVDLADTSGALQTAVTVSASAGASAYKQVATSNLIGTVWYRWLVLSTGGNAGASESAAVWVVLL